MTAFTVRRAEAPDIDAIARLWEALVAHHRAIDQHLPPATPHGAMRYARRLIDHLEDPMACVLVAEFDGRVIGYVLGVVVELAPEMFQQEASGFLADLYVDAGHRRLGMGRALVSALASWFAERGLSYFEWHAAVRNPEAIAFWRAIGGRDVMVRMRADLAQFER
ncbi:MAG: GNAT family N-acetyltransferase [Aggregatilineales bacterium]